MITISDKIIKKQHNFWNNCLFHPTDAIEDPWGKRILDRMSLDGAIKKVRIYTMFEDIVYLNETGELQFDFRISDLRLDYMIEKGYDLLLSYGGIPDCIAKSNDNKTSVSKNKTRYKGKMWNTSPPKDYKLWEEICYEYTKHNIERYGIERVLRWHCQCLNEPDISLFFLSELPNSEADERGKEYCKLYEAFVNGIQKASKDITVGGPALADRLDFLEIFLNFVKSKKIRLDFISLHNYGTTPDHLNNNTKSFNTQNNLDNHKRYFDVICKCGFVDTSIKIDEWGMSSHGFFNREECPAHMCRETEVFSAYFVRLIYDLIHSEYKIEDLMICLSGQHEMTEDFTGFRNFFTLNFIAKPIYNAYILASKLNENILEYESDNKNLCVIPTRDEKGNYAVLMSYSSECFSEEISDIVENITFAENIKDKQVTIWCIDKETTNPYRLYEKLKINNPNTEEISMLQEEGKLKPVFLQSGAEKISLKFSPNSTYLITIG